MVIHRHLDMLVGVPVSPYISRGWLYSYLRFQTRSGRVAGYLWQRAARRSITHAFNADFPVQENMIHPPYVDVKRSFFMSIIAPPEIFDTLIRVSGHTLLVSGYFDNRVERNANLKRDFPLIPWHGEIAVLFVGKRKPFLTRGPPDSVIHFAIAS